jgi:hypothetical protein
MGLMKTKHPFISPKADGTDSTLVKPSDWNAEHTVETDAAAVYLGRDASAPGPVQEFPINHASSGDDFTIYTKAQVDAIIAAAIAALSPGPTTGDIIASFASAKPGWLILNGITIGNVGSASDFPNATAEALFKLFWALNGNTWPVFNASTGAPSRGATADADWTSTAPYKKIPIPDASARGIIMLDYGRGIIPSLTALGQQIGEPAHALTVAELASHLHGIQDGYLTAGGGSGTLVAGGGGGNAIFNTQNEGGGAAHNNIQPSLGANLFIKL